MLKLATVPARSQHIETKAKHRQLQDRIVLYDFENTKQLVKKLQRLQDGYGTKKRKRPRIDQRPGEAHSFYRQRPAAHRHQPKTFFYLILASFTKGQGFTSVTTRYQSRRAEQTQPPNPPPLYGSFHYQFGFRQRFPTANTHIRMSMHLSIPTPCLSTDANPLLQQIWDQDGRLGRALAWIGQYKVGSQSDSRSTSPR